MAVEYEDNYGFWKIDEPWERAFFEHVQRQSVSTICERCKRPVRLVPAKSSALVARVPLNAARRSR